MDATNAVLVEAGYPAIGMADYEYGCRYTTPDRFAYHSGAGDAAGAALGAAFDAKYVALVSPETCAPYPRIGAVLAGVKARGVRQGALSNACFAYVDAVADRNPEAFGAVLEVRLGPDNVPKAKPHPDGLLAACAKLGADPARSVYVGDSPSDGAAARAAGCTGVGVTYGANAREKLEGSFDYLVDSVDELQVLLLGGPGGEGGGLCGSVVCARED